MNGIRRWVSLLLSTSTLLVGFAYAPGISAEEINTQPVSVEMIQEESTVQPGRPFWVAFRVQIPEKWHAYWKNPGDAGMPLAVEWQLPEEWKAGPLQWPTPERFSFESIIGYGYSGEILLLAEITPSAHTPVGRAETLGADLRWLICSDTNCLPGESHADLAVAFDRMTPTPQKAFQSFFAQGRERLPKAVEEIQVTREQDRLVLRAKDIGNSGEKNVYFCPESSNMIDIRSEVLSVAQENGATVVTLRDRTETATKAESLTGVLVLDSQKGYAIDAPIRPAPLIDSSDSISLSAGPQESFMWILLLAFAGGMILNLMPCVLPVLSFKVMSFVKMAGESRSLTLKHGLFFSFGVLLSFWVLAGVMLTLQAYGSAVGWGFQLQDPLFVAVLAGLLFVFSLSLFGVFELGTSVASMAGQSQVAAAQRTGYLSSFLSGILATAIATPCTGPFLGTAVGFAFTVAAPQAMLVFTSLGAGMAFPYLLLSAFPRLLRFMPKPGTWMVVFKEVMGFLLLATVVWLIWVFGAETNLQAVILLMIAFLAFAVGSWIYGKFATPMSTKLTRYFAYACAVAFFLGGGYLTYSSTTDLYIDATESAMTQSRTSHGWITYSPETVEAYRQEGKPLFIDFTAEWCLSCKANHLVLASASVDEAFTQAGVVKMKADWTKRDPIVTEALRKFGRNSIPLYVLYLPGSDQPQILPQVLTPETVLQALRNR